MDLIIKLISKYMFYKNCIQRRLPLKATRTIVYRLAKEQEQSRQFVVSTKYAINEQKDSFYLNKDYYDRIFLLNGEACQDLFDNKAVLYNRCSGLLGRTCMDVTQESEKAILDFIKKTKKFVGKRNYSSGALGFTVYESGKMSAEEILKEIRERKQNLLESYIEQHESISGIYPNSVSTIRIHTVNNGEEIRSYIKPKIRFGCNGAITDIGGKKGSYRAVLNEDGSVEMAVCCDRHGYVKKAVRHHNTKIYFSEVRIPYVKESIELAKEAAKKFPEVAYIGWDVAITPTGPVIVEGNCNSGCFSTYQIMNYLYKGVGMKEQINEMLDFAERKN